MEPTETICPNCEKGKIFVDVETGDLLCKKCGYVSQDRAIEDSSPSVDEMSMHAPKKFWGKSRISCLSRDQNQRAVVTTSPRRASSGHSENVVPRRF